MVGPKIIPTTGAADNKPATSPCSCGSTLMVAAEFNPGVTMLNAMPMPANAK